MLADSVGRSRGRKRSAGVGGADSGGRGRGNTPAAQTRRKAAETGEDDDQSEKKFRKCEKSGCPATYPVCFASASDRCARNGYTSRWYHLSCGEHFCNECFDHYYRSHKDGYETFSSWKRVWTSNGKSEPSLKAFMADQQLPYWVQCSKADCGRWRQLSKESVLTAALASSYRCGMKNNSVKSEGSDACSQPEDVRVAGVTDSWWLSMLILPPLLKDSPASPFLSAYYPDCVGMSPSVGPGNQRQEHRRTAPPHIPGLSPYFQPFYQPNECGKALCVRPDMMELDELYEFPEFSRDPTMYLALRNLVLAAWNRDCKEVLTLQRCAPHVIVRGLVRIRCVQELERVLDFMTRKGLINTGVLQVKRPLLPESQHYKVLVIGAGAAGLAAARQLQNFGMQVVVLEARERIGGRVWDDASLGMTVGRGAQIVNGCVNNPIALMCEQLGLPMHRLDVHTHTLTHTPVFSVCSWGCRCTGWMYTHTHTHAHTHTLTHTPVFSCVQLGLPMHRLDVHTHTRTHTHSHTHTCVLCVQLGLPMHRLDVHTHTHTRTHTHSHTHTCVLLCAAGAADAQVGCTHTHTHTHTHTLSHTHLCSLCAAGAADAQVGCTHTLTHTHTLSHTHLCSPVCSWGCRCTGWMYTHTHTHTHTHSHTHTCVLCVQLGLPMHRLGARCELIQDGGLVTDPALDKRMDFHFNAVLDAVSEWRKDKPQSQDAPLGEKIQEVYKAFLQESGLLFSELEENVLHFHLSNLEYACGSTLDQVSARSWDHNECFAQFSGDHTLLIDGYSSVLHNLAQGLDIRLNTAVQHVEYSGDAVKVTSFCGSHWTAQKVLVTLPLALLQNNTVCFSPPLPERKLKAIHSLGAGAIEKVALQFPTRFWDSKVQGADYFGHVPASVEKRGLFSVFYDMRPQGEECVLMTVITGEALALVRDLQDSQVVDLCMSVLRELFQEQEVPEPVKFLVTHWSRDAWAQMSYSFVKTGGSGEAYDIMAEDVQGKLFFAGEATNRHFPQTVTGAYLSGVREASKIAAQ
ncbi:lysine-specific histone demethylase 1B isoform X1 [Pimephales promelas]|uniref:lysine-specific histone demethylase 1B isoform X1 n=1 Tax=Pimephales promelas TaxID=90988 RepID=UPI001955536C|nr:lysine-specific histone demethylase 1B isoform X1 [Pimephales promelas]